MAILAGGAQRPPACKAFDRDGNVIYCSSLSKTLAPGWRIGWIAAGRYHSAILQAPHGRRMGRRAAD
ncbi:transcriptional regulator [Klebsiella michiganensis]|uniref:Transcriptional regulator n=1 Tax=Klebsiella michiganensis TaxID=1134687 RepID=A0A7H4MZW9_9ENTR|nr:transcriptional regulator [Klebsiella michiganensis]